MSFWATDFWASNFWATDFWADSTPPPPSSDAYSGGTAVSSLGVMQTDFLDDVTPVPGTRVFINGIAHTTGGTRYVAAWPGAGIVSYSAGRAVRPDGAQCIIQAAAGVYLNGFGYSTRGELCVTVTPGSNFINGISVNGGNTAVSELS